MVPSLMTFLTAILTKTDWSKTTLVFNAVRNIEQMFDSLS